MSEPITTAKRKMFRVGILYTGKHFGKFECSFVKAISKEEATKYVEDNMKSSIKHLGIKDEGYTIEVSPSSKAELDFYAQNRALKNYTGLIN